MGRVGRLWDSPYSGSWSSLRASGYVGMTAELGAPSPTRVGCPLMMLAEGCLVPSQSATPPPPAAGTRAGFCTHHLASWRGVPRTRVAMGGSAPAPQELSLGMEKPLSAPPPSLPAAWDHREQGHSEKWGLQGSHRCVFAGKVLRGGRRVGLLAPPCAPRPRLCALLCALCSGSAPATEPAPPASSPRARGGQGVWCGRHK